MTFLAEFKNVKSSRWQIIAKMFTVLTFVNSSCRQEILNMFETLTFTAQWDMVLKRKRKKNKEKMAGHIRLAALQTIGSS